MKPVNIENLSDILRRIWSGELEHQQGAYFCGSACCLAGWDVVLNSGVTKTTSERENSLTDPSEAGNPYSDPWAWSMENNGLTESEANLIYSPFATKQLHRLTLKALESGLRLDKTSNGRDCMSFDIKPVMSDEEIERGTEGFYDNGIVQVIFNNAIDLWLFLGFLDPSGKNPDITFCIDDDSTCVTVFSDV